MRNECRHFNGVQNGKCRAGVDYQSVIDPNKPLGMGRFPCLASDTARCPSADPFTDTEVEQQEAESAAALAKYLKDLENDICPHCGVEVEHKRQVGRCGDGDPCGHRLYQGRV